jgi:type I restriction enzyme M protein
MGKKNCELAPDDIQRICDTFLAFEETPQSKIFPNAAFGYWKVKVERPLRLHSQLTPQRIETLRYASGDEDIRAALHDQLGDGLFDDFASVREQLEKALEDWGQADEEEDNESGGGKSSLPEKKKKKLLDQYVRNARIIEEAFETI